jgi:hypothetical protein
MLESGNGKERSKRLKGKRRQVQGGPISLTGVSHESTPYPVGPHSPFLRLFQWAWQSKDVLKLVGDGGKKLKGKIFEKEDSDVIDSDLTVDYVVTVPFSPMPPETQDINILKRRSWLIWCRARFNISIRTQSISVTFHPD